MGFLASKAPLGADVNFVVQITVLLLLFVGAYFARMGQLSAHRRIMVIVIVMQSGALIFWMAPSFVMHIQALRPLEFGPFITIIHIVAGYLSFFLAIGSALHKPLVSTLLKWTMRTTFVAWTSTAILGIAFYVYYYLFS